jgi:predicted  nucleic acid-binding Zn-ribbon protein
MTETPALDAALARLDMALATMEAAIERRAAADRNVDAYEDEVARMGEDRSRLANELDAEKARAGRLEETNREVSRRLVAAMESIRVVLETHGG